MNKALNENTFADGMQHLTNYYALRNIQTR